jgi:hypothetical protein
MGGDPGKCFVDIQSFSDEAVSIWLEGPVSYNYSLYWFCQHCVRGIAAFPDNQSPVDF